MEPYRAQLFLQIIEERSQNIKSLTSGLMFSFSEDFLRKIETYAFSEVDRILLPSFITFFHDERVINQKENINWSYKDFYIEDGRWHPRIQLFVEKYNFVCGLCKVFVHSYFDGIEEFIIALKNDVGVLGIKRGDVIDISVGLSDRHNGGRQVLILEVNDSKIIFKPRSVETDKSLYEINDRFLDKKLRIPKVIHSTQTYGWIEFINHEKVDNQSGLKEFYYNFGFLLSVLHGLNFMDGHHENFIAQDCNLWLIDSETILTNLSYFKKRTDVDVVDFTGMLQKLELGEDDDSYTSCLQAYTGTNYYPLMPKLVNEATTEIALNYSWKVDRGVARNYPCAEKLDLTAYENDIGAGYREGIKYLRKHKSAIISHVVSRPIKCRQIIRHTLYYTYLLCLITHPQKVVSKNEALTMLRDKLEGFDPDIISHEIDALLNWDVPCFYQRTNSRDLYSASNLVQKDFLQKRHWNLCPKSLKV